MPSILFEKSEQVLTLSLNRPNVINALNKTLFEELSLALKKVDECKCVVIRGQGEKGFCAGADVKELNKMDLPQVASYLELANKTLDALSYLPYPTIALLHGYTLGGGLELALACDFIIAEENTILGMPETTIGLIPGFGGEKRLVERIGAPKAKELIFTGKRLTTLEALQMKLIDVSVKKDFLQSVLTEWISTFSPQLSYAKKAFCQKESAPLFIEAFKRKDR